MYKAGLMFALFSFVLLLGLALNHDPSDLSSQVARITGMNHWCPA
jgi:hypothetical protein